ncbi:unnamed protein product [Linum tenue]|uniref:Vesicle transport protein n=1 Tax=Linum tenue TaxID=586396 RepID=A0AAV0L986_9ROSI|nr:unnamed protein product [Linum tenue]
MEKMNQAMEKMKILVGMEVEEDHEEQPSASSRDSSSLIDDFNRNCALSSKQSMLFFFHPIKFGVTFTFDNLLALGSTAFLIGPKRQVTMMLDPVLIYVTALYLASIIIALFCAVYVHSKILTLFAVILEFGALFWYNLSYVPFARSMVSKIMVGCLDTEF